MPTTTPIPVQPITPAQTTEPSVQPTTDPDLVLATDAPQAVVIEQPGTQPEVIANTLLQETEVEEAVSWFEDFSGTHVEILDAQHEVAAPEAPLATGMTATLVRNADHAVLDEAPIVVQGDVLGTGEINIAQLVAMARDLNGTQALTGLYLQAGDLDTDGHITIVDLVKEAHMLIQMETEMPNV